MRTFTRLLCGLVTAGVLVPAVVVLTWSGAADTSRHTSGSRAVVNHDVQAVTRVNHDEVVDFLATNLAKDELRYEPETNGLSPPALPEKSVAWKRHVHEACSAMRMTSGGMVADLAPKKLSHIIVDDKYKLLYCQIPKVASTTWRRVFLQLSGKLNTDAFKILANDVHHKYDQYLTYLSDLPADGVAHRLRDYFKFVFVREPFERVLSAYKNKFAARTNSATYFKWTFGRKIVEQYRKHEPIPANNTGSDVKFGEFVDYLIGDHKKIPMNEHWDQFYKLCYPCHIDYDFIGKLESIDDDSKFIMDLNKLSDQVKVPKRAETRYPRKKTTSFMKEFYAKLTPSQISGLYNMYRADFSIFNYTVPADVQEFM